MWKMKPRAAIGLATVLVLLLLSSQFVLRARDKNHDDIGSIGTRKSCVDGRGPKIMIRFRSPPFVFAPFFASCWNSGILRFLLEPVTLRQGARVIEDSRRLRMA
jgi:hypothetical protein